MAHESCRARFAAGEEVVMAGLGQLSGGRRRGRRSCACLLFARQNRRKASVQLLVCTYQRGHHFVFVCRGDVLRPFFKRLVADPKRFCSQGNRPAKKFNNCCFFHGFYLTTVQFDFSQICPFFKLKFKNKYNGHCKYQPKVHRKMIDFSHGHILKQTKRNHG